jgi:hypothetical protein
MRFRAVAPLAALAIFSVLLGAPPPAGAGL